jgi:hypothetical protein
MGSTQTARQSTVGGWRIACVAGFVLGPERTLDPCVSSCEAARSDACERQRGHAVSADEIPIPADH